MQTIEPAVTEVTNRIKALREDLGLSIADMAQATGRGEAEYIAQENGESDLSFTFLFKCANALGVDVIELLTGEAPHLRGYEVTRAGEGLSIRRRAGFEYLHQASMFADKLCEPFIVTAPYLPEEQERPIHLSRHEGQELDFIISGRLRFAYEDHIEELGAGDTLYYNSGRGHGMIAIGGQPCVFLAVVLKPQLAPAHPAAPAPAPAPAAAPSAAAAAAPSAPAAAQTGEPSAGQTPAKATINIS